jgi:CRISPR-associated protein Cas5t
MGRKWNGEYFQISIQGDYEVIYRDYVWFKKYNLKDKKLERLPLQVPILYNLSLLIHIKASEELLKEIESGLREPKELLFLSGGEYPVKVEEVKRVKYFEKKISEESSVSLKYNVYIPRELKEELSFSSSDEGGSEEGVLYTLPYFYRSLEEPRVFSYIDVYYFLKGTQVYGSLFFDEDGEVIFFAESQVEEEKEETKKEGREHVRFYVGNWLMASACTGVLKVLESAGEDIEKYVEGRFLKIPKDLWSKLPELYVDYFLKDKERVKVLLEREYKQKGERINPCVLIARRLSDFHHDSVFTNPSSISKFKGCYSENLEEVLRKVKEYFLSAYERLLNKREEYLGTCFFCYERPAQSYVDATTFTPLFASLKTARNFIWDPIVICKECEFLLYFTSIGFHRTAGRYFFIYIPDNPLETYSKNLVLSTKKEIEQEKYGRILSVVKYVLELERHKSNFILQNIYFVEIEKVSDTTANIYSFHISPNLARAIRKLINKYPKIFRDIFFEFLFYIYTGRSLYEFLFFLLLGYFRKESFRDLEANTIDARIVRAGRDMEFLSSSLLFFINFQEVLNMKGLSMNEQKDYIKWAFGAGRALKKVYKGNEGLQRKFESFTYRLLEAVRRKDKEYFIHHLIRAYLEVEKEIPFFFKEALDDKNFYPIAYAFLIGLNSEERGKAEGGATVEEATDEGEGGEAAERALGKE